MYLCPNCNERIEADFVEEFDGGFGRHDEQLHTFDCPICGRAVDVSCTVKVEYALDGDGKDAEERDRSLVRVAPLDNRLRDPEAFLTVPPAEVFMLDDPVCMGCGQHKHGCRCAADLMAAGWRVVPEFPGLRATCPQCYGG